MNPHVGAAMWIVAAFVGFLVWWPIGVAFLTAITITAISQQLTGYRNQQPLPPPGPPRHHYIGGWINPPMKQINQIETRAITDRSKQ